MKDESATLSQLPIKLHKIISLHHLKVKCSLCNCLNHCEQILYTHRSLANGRKEKPNFLSHLQCLLFYESKDLQSQVWRVEMPKIKQLRNILEYFHSGQPMVVPWWWCNIYSCNLLSKPSLQILLAMSTSEVSAKWPWNVLHHRNSNIQCKLELIPNVPWQFWNGWIIMTSWLTISS